MWVLYQNGNLESIALLLEKGADVNITDDDGDAALAWAIMGGADGEKLTALHGGAGGGDVQAVSHSGRGLLHIAAQADTVNANTVLGFWMRGWIQIMLMILIIPPFPYL